MGGEEEKIEWIDNSFRKFGCEGEHVTEWWLEVKEGFCLVALDRR